MRIFLISLLSMNILRAAKTDDSRKMKLILKKRGKGEMLTILIQLVSGTHEGMLKAYK